MKNKSVQLSESHHLELRKIAERLDKNIGEVAEQCVLYISKNRIDPYNIKEGNPIEAIREYHKITIGYITEMEKKNFKPLIDDLNLLSIQIQRSFSNLPTLNNQEANIKKMDELKRISEFYRGEIEKLRVEHTKAITNGKEQYNKLDMVYNRLNDSFISLTTYYKRLVIDHETFRKLVLNSTYDFVKEISELSFLTGKDKLINLCNEFVRNLEANLKK